MNQDGIRKLSAFVDELGEDLMVGFATVTQKDDPMAWREVSSALKGHLRTKMLKAISETMDILRKIPKLQGKVTGSVVD